MDHARLALTHVGHPTVFFTFIALRHGFVQRKYSVAVSTHSRAFAPEQRLLSLRSSMTKGRHTGTVSQISKFAPNSDPPALALRLHRGRQYKILVQYASVRTKSQAESEDHRKDEQTFLYLGFGNWSKILICF